jgi:hypothetical protein
MMKPLFFFDETSCNCFKWCGEGVDGGDDLTNIQCKPI